MNNSSPTVIVTNFGFHSSPPSTTRQQPHLRHLLDVIQQSKETRVRAKMLPFSCRLMLAVCIWLDVAPRREEISPTPLWRSRAQLTRNDLGRHIPEPSASKKVIVIQNRVTILKADYTVLLLSFQPNGGDFLAGCSAHNVGSRVFLADSCQ